MATEKVIDFVAQDQIYKDYVRKEKDSVGQWVRAFDFMLSEESLVRNSYENVSNIISEKSKGENCKCWSEKQ